MSLSEQNRAAIWRVLPGNTSITNFMDFRCGFADLEALLNSVREEAYKEGWTDREDDLIAGVNRINAARAEGVAALQQAAEGWVLVPREPTEAMTLAGATDNTPRTATNSLDRMFETVGLIYKVMIAAAPLPQQTALVDYKGLGPHEPTACGASAPSEPPRSNREKIESVLNDALRLQVDTLIGEVLTLVPQGYVGWDYHGRHWTDQISKRAADAVLAENEEHLRLAMNGVKAALPILYTLRDRQQNVETWGLRGRIAALEAALRFAHPAELDISGAQRSELTRSAQDEPISTPPPPTDGEVK